MMSLQDIYPYIESTEYQLYRIVFLSSFIVNKPI